MPLIPVNLFWAGGLGGFLIMGTKECACGIQNSSSWFLVWAGAGNHTGVCKDHLYPPIFPGIAFSKPLKWELIPQSSRSRWEQRKNIHVVLGEDGESPAWASRCHLIAAGFGTHHWGPQTNPIPNWNNWFLPYLPSQWQKKKRQDSGIFSSE